MPTLKKLPRGDLNEKATKLGIEGADQLPNRQAVIDAIEQHKAEVDASNPFGHSARVISVFGPFNSRCLIDVSSEVAASAFGQLGEAARTNAIDAVERDLAEIREKDEKLADSAQAAVAVRLAYELEDPYNSATSKSMCAKALNETLEQLRKRAPEKEEGGALDRLAAEREERLKGAAAAED